MLFNSLDYLLFFLPITVAIYYFIVYKQHHFAAKIWLTFASLFFYSYWNIKYLPLILTSIIFNFFMGRRLAKSANKKILTVGVIANIILLGYFKYADFFIDNVNAISDIGLKHLNIVLPLAISFFTFQQIAYLVDSFRGNTKEYDFFSYSLFVTFFPQLIAGPIVSHSEMLPQFNDQSNLKVSYKNIFLGIYIFAIGLFKKAVIADTFAQYATLGFDQIDNLTMIDGWFTSLSYTVQIYFDFSGYCDMAIGSALFFNIKLPINFNSPYKALNIQDFWRRWHMTLSRFLRDYIYFPLGGSRKGEARACFNIFIVFLVGGLWHGAAWTFVFWGFLHGMANLIHRVWKKTNIQMNKYLAWFITFNFINISWIYFRAKTFADGNKVLKAMFDIESMMNLPAFKSRYYLYGFECHSKVIVWLIVVLILSFITKNGIERMNSLEIKSSKHAYAYGIGLAVVSTIALCKLIIVPYSEFIYFNF